MAMVAMAQATSLSLPHSPCSHHGPDLQRRTVNASSMPSSTMDLPWTAPGQQRRRCKPGDARVVCIGGDKDAREAARKALEQALGGKKEAFSKWDDEIRRRETRGSGGGRRRGRGDGSGGGGGGGGGRRWGGGGIPDPQDENSWSEAKQIVLAFTGLIGVYLLLTNGRSSLLFLLKLPRYMGRGGKKAAASLINFPLLLLRGFRRAARKPSASSPTPVPVMASNNAADGEASAKARVMNKWGRD